MWLRAMGNSKWPAPITLDLKHRHCSTAWAGAQRVSARYCRAPDCAPCVVAGLTFVGHEVLYPRSSNVWIVLLLGSGAAYLAAQAFIGVCSRSASTAGGH